MFIIAAFETRKDGYTPDQFADHYDDIHIPLLKSLVGDAFPSTHSRYYTKRVSDAPDFIPLIFAGSLEDVAFDVISIMTFEDDAHAMRFQAKYGEPEIYARMKADEDVYIKEKSLKVFGLHDPHVTKP
jgi:hypothetical protein